MVDVLELPRAVPCAMFQRSSLNRVLLSITPALRVHAFILLFIALRAAAYPSLVLRRKFKLKHLVGGSWCIHATRSLGGSPGGESWGHTGYWASDAMQHKFLVSLLTPKMALIHSL